MNPETLFLSQLPTIERIIRFAARRFHLYGADAEDFDSYVKLKLIEDNYAVIRKFEGRSQFTTYLATVIKRMAANYRVQQWGKWRPSAEAKRLGDLATALERLIRRDGYTFSEAAQLLTRRDDLHCTVGELKEIYQRLPVPVESKPLDDVTAQLEGPNAKAGRRGQAARIGRILDEVAAGLPDEDRLIIRMRFVDGEKVPKIARTLHIDQKKLYKRLDKILLMFRQALMEQQIDSDEIAAVIAGDDIDDEITALNVRTIKTADIPGIYVDPATARRTLQELQREREASGRK